MSLMDYIDKGGTIADILLCLNIIGFSIMFWKLFIITKFKFRRIAIMEELVHMMQESKTRLKGETTIVTFARDQIRFRVKSLERGLDTIRIIATISPLLGLLGTVVGILGSFENISIYGLDDPTIFAESISLALITTIGGLIVAVPHYVGYNYFIGYMYKLEDSIEREAMQNFFAAGDGAGNTRGMLQSSVAGIIVAEAIAKRV